MHRLLTLVFAILCLPGCFAFFDEHGKGGDDDDCLLPAGDTAEPSAIAPQRNPDQLTCESFGGGGTCNPECGPCPLSGEEGAALAPIPSWGFCFSACESHDEAACEADEACRVIKDARCAIDGTCLTDFLGCVATDQFIDPSIDCTAVTDGQQCSQSPACTAYHTSAGCSITSGDPTCANQFEFCGPEGRGAGQCSAQAACDRLPPACPQGTTPGVADGCFTDVCIPDELCEIVAQPAA